MKFLLRSDSAISNMQLFVPLTKLADFDFCEFDLVVSVFLRQDDSHYVRVRDNRIGKTFWFALFSPDSFTRFPHCTLFFSFRHSLLKEYLKFREQYDINIAISNDDIDLPF